MASHGYIVTIPPMTRTRPHTSRKTLGVALLLALLAGGCVERTVSITSEPPGAVVWLNDEEVGRTPVVVPFTFHGVYDVRLEREGHRPLWTKAKTNEHWWELPGPDLVAEAIPDGKSETKWHFTLEPDTGVDPDALVDRAKQLRDESTPKPTTLPPDNGAADDDTDADPKAGDTDTATDDNSPSKTD